ncbi:dienelactone hydrolase family protein [Synechococcus sp. CCY9202]|uniref:dienelactone hydrolase family protein n=1 Tax=Synechococcus sp. CCY9202 TaxID=174698 RepID=UPI002B21B32A|nr:dienelactone hydrolase family protein [Synechococcus sp. CCY9202]MEA5421767.1 dienelactone hydrolase family protein [Synechococcus sp. CCY9202]
MTSDAAAAQTSVAPAAADWVTIPVAASADVAATELRCWWEPARGGFCRGGVLVLPEVFGVNGWVRGMAGRLAAESYAALAMPLFSRTAPELDLPYDAASLAEGRHHKDQTTTAQILADAAAAAAWLTGQLEAMGLELEAMGLGEGSSGGLSESEGRSVGLGCLGFCFGGHAALLSATLPAIAATADFYGAGVASGRPGGGPPSLREVDRIPGRLLCVCGRQDPLIPQADAAAIRSALEAANRIRADGPPEARHRYLEVEAGHGFLCDARDDYNSTAAALGWAALLEFFAETL